MAKHLISPSPRRGCAVAVLLLGFLVGSASPLSTSAASSAHEARAGNLMDPPRRGGERGFSSISIAPANASAIPDRTHGAFEGSVVRVAGDPILAAQAAIVTAEELACRTLEGGAAPAIAGGCGAPVEEWVATMLQGLRETKGACIAAPQVGVSKRLIIMSIPAERIREEAQYLDLYGEGKRISAPFTEVMPPVVLANPELRPLADDVPNEDMQETWESCLSIPGKHVVVKRHKSIRYRAQRLDGTVIEGVAHGRLALTLQHEVDHLGGILMTDVAEAAPSGASEPRADGLGGVSSTTHWDLMGEPGYDMRTFTIPGSHHAA